MGDNKAKTNVQWESTPTVQTYGSPTDTWNVDNFTPSLINLNQGFGIALRVTHPANALGNQPFLYVDCVSLTIYYTEGSVPPTPPVPPNPFNPTTILPDHTVSINNLGFYAETPTPDPDYDQVQLDEIDIENGFPVFYPTYYKYCKLTFKATLKGKIPDLRTILKTIVNTPVNFSSIYQGSYVAWVQYKPTYTDGTPNTMSVEFTVQKIMDGKVATTTTTTNTSNTPSSTSTPTCPDNALQINCTGSNVATLQDWLDNNFGASLLRDGIFGPITENVVKLFQTEVSITVDGIVGPETRQAMANYNG
jgi:hypothetical protein